MLICHLNGVWITQLTHTTLTIFRYNVKLLEEFFALHFLSRKNNYLALIF